MHCGRFRSLAYSSTFCCGTFLYDHWPSLHTPTHTYAMRNVNKLLITYIQSRIRFNWSDRSGFLYTMFHFTQSLDKFFVFSLCSNEEPVPSKIKWEMMILCVPTIGQCIHGKGAHIQVNIDAACLHVYMSASIFSLFDWSPEKYTWIWPN